MGEPSPPPSAEFAAFTAAGARIAMEKPTTTIIVSEAAKAAPPASAAPPHTSAYTGLAAAEHSKAAIDLIGEEFVSKLKSETPEETEAGGGGQTATGGGPVTVVMAGPSSTETTTVTAGGEQSHLVYCNLNDLDLSGGSAETYSLQSLAAAPAAQSAERNPYSAVSTILLQGGIGGILQVRKLRYL